MSSIKIYGFNRSFIGIAKTLNPLSKNAKTYHNHLKNIASYHSVASLSSPQLNDMYRAMTILNKKYLKPNQWINYTKAKQNQYDAYQNIKIITTSTEVGGEWEECSSYPGMKFFVERPEKVSFRCDDEKFQEKTHEFSGFMARVFLHEYDHIEGVDLLKNAEKIDIIDPKLKQEHGESIQRHFEIYRKQREELSQTPEYKDSRKIFLTLLNVKDTQIFNQLRRQIVYSVIDSSKK